MFALVERFIGAKMLEVSRGHWLGDQVALDDTDLHRHRAAKRASGAPDRSPGGLCAGCRHLSAKASSQLCP
jgi:hypothetical protein